MSGDRLHTSEEFVSKIFQFYILPEFVLDFYQKLLIFNHADDVFVLFDELNRYLLMTMCSYPKVLTKKVT